MVGEVYVGDAGAEMYGCASSGLCRRGMPVLGRYVLSPDHDRRTPRGVVWRPAEEIDRDLPGVPVVERGPQNI